MRTTIITTIVLAAMALGAVAHQKEQALKLTFPETATRQNGARPLAPPVTKGLINNGAGVKQRSAKSKGDENVELILSENFDKLSKGDTELIDCPYYPRTKYDEMVYSAYEKWIAEGHDPYQEEFPAPEFNPEKDLSDLYRTGSPSISADYTQTAGWTGSLVWAHDKAMAIYMPDNGGYLVTPYNLNLHGVVRVSFRARSLQAAYDWETNEYDTSTFDRSYLYVIPAKNGGASYVDSDAPVFQQVEIPGDDQWHQFSFEFETLYDGSDCGIQFNGMTGGTDGLIIDDIRIERMLDKSITPRHLSSDHFSDDGFRINYDADKYADSFLVNVWERRRLGEKIDLLLDFNDINTDGEGRILKEDIPVGWTFDLNPSAPQTEVNPSDGSLGIQFVADEKAYAEYDWLPYVMTPDSAPIGKFEFDLYCLEDNTTVFTTSGIPKVGQLILLGYDEYGEPDYIFDGYLTDGDESELKVGDRIHFSTDELYDEDGNEIEIENKYNSIALVVRPRGNQRILLDNLHFVSDSPSEDILVVEDKSSSQKFCDINGLDMDCDHFFTVRAVNGENVSQPSGYVKAFGVRAPVALPATDVDLRGSFTANWESVAGADGYIIELSEKLVADKDIPDFTVLHEGFDKTATAEWAKYDMDHPYDMYPGIAPMDDFTSMSGWMAKGGSLINGHLGCQQSAEGDMNYLQMPALNLAYGDKSAKVMLKAVSKNAEQLIVQYSMDSDVEPLMIPFTNGMAEGTIYIPDATDAQLYFYAGIYGASYTPAFYIDYVDVVQTLKAGDEYDQIIKQQVINNPDENSYDFFDLLLNPDVHYVYRLRSLMEGEKYFVSESGNEIEVKEFHSGIDEIDTARRNVAAIGLDIICGEEMTVYNIEGVVVGRGKVCHVPAPGLYLVRTHCNVEKIVVR